MATIQVDSLSAEAVQTAISTAASGDTISLPAGKATWNHGVSADKSLTIEGAGPEKSVIEREPSFHGTLFTLGPLASDEPLRLSGIGFDNVTMWSSYDLVCVFVAGTRGKRSGLTKIRIDHCQFEAGKRQLWIDGWAEGVTDHCTFRNAREDAIFVRGEGYPVYEHPESGILGSMAAWYIEDCEFTNDDSLSDFLGIADLDYGGASVWRHCNVTVARSGGSGVWNTHGNQSYWDTSSQNYFTGLRRLEIYDCVISLPTSYRLAYFRGGRVLIADNQFFTSDGSNPPIAAISEEEGWMGDVFRPLRTQWPGEEQINSSFFYNNTCNDRPCVAPKPWNDNDSTFLQENRDFFTCPPDETTVTMYPEIPLPSKADYPYQLSSSKYWPPTTSFVKAPYPHPLISESPEPEPPGEPTYSKWLDRLAGWIKTNPPTADD